MRWVAYAVTCLLAGFLLSCVSDSGEAVTGSKFDKVWTTEQPLPPARYGNVLITRLTKKSTHPSVAFSHWMHRRFYTCRVCHFELGFAYKTNTSGISEEKNRRGEFCGACHNDRIAFSVLEEDNCRKCHSGTLGHTDARFVELNGFPKTLYGDQISWVKALRKGLIQPKQSLVNEHFEQIPFDKNLRLEPEWRGVKTRAFFPHLKHTEWLDCADCHPDIFNIQRKGTKHFLMNHINDGKFCGVCHLTVAFPVQDCRRCHPDLD
jgi:c(7)-type cytochrome triheme protein